MSPVSSGSLGAVIEDLVDSQMKEPTRPGVYEFLVEGSHSSGRKFCQEYIVIAGDTSEADEALGACLASFEEILDWRVRQLTEVTATEGKGIAAEQYAKRGPFTIFDPEFHWS